MNKNIFFSSFDTVVSQARILKFVIISLTLTIIVGSYSIYKAVNHQTIIVLPPVMNDKISFIGGKPSEVYLQDTARQVVNLAFNYSPATARTQFNQLLRLFLPENYPQAYQVWYDLAGRVEETGVSNVFYAHEIKTAADNITVTGENIRLSNNYEIEKSSRTYIVGFKTINGKFGLTYIKEKA